MHISNRMKSELTIVACLDNNQALYSRHFQRDGIATSVEKLTATVLKQCLVNYEVPFQHTANYNNIYLSYIDQAVPSPLKMIQYESMMTIEERYSCIKSIDDEQKDYNNSSLNIDVTPVQVLSYYRIAGSCWIM